MTNISQKKLYPWPERDPMIDVIERKDTVTVVVVLPRIIEEDVWFSFRDGYLTVEVSKYGEVFRKRSRVNIGGDLIKVKKSSVRNSVLEVVFEKIPPMLKR